MLQTEKPVELSQIDRKVDNRIIVQTFSFLFIPTFVKVLIPLNFINKYLYFLLASLRYS